MTGPKDLLVCLRPGWRGYHPSLVLGKRCGVDGMTLLHTMCAKFGDEYIKRCKFDNIILGCVRWVLALCTAVGPAGSVYLCFDGHVLPAKMDEQMKRHGPDALREAWDKVKAAVDSSQPAEAQYMHTLSSYISPDLFLGLWNQLTELRVHTTGKLKLEVAPFENDSQLAAMNTR